MYENFGDVNFMEWGATFLKDNGNGEFDFIIVYPWACSDGYSEDYYFCEGVIDTKDTWIDREAVNNFIGGANSEADFAIGCIDFYGGDNFSGDTISNIERDDLLDILKYRGIYEV